MIVHNWVKAELVKNLQTPAKPKWWEFLIKSDARAPFRFDNLSVALCHIGEFEMLSRKTIYRRSILKTLPIKPVMLTSPYSIFFKYTKECEFTNLIGGYDTIALLKDITNTKGLYNPFESVSIVASKSLPYIRLSPEDITSINCPDNRKYACSISFCNMKFYRVSSKVTKKQAEDMVK